MTTTIQLYTIMRSIYYESCMLWRARQYSRPTANTVQWREQLFSMTSKRRWQIIVLEIRGERDSAVYVINTSARNASMRSVHITSHDVPSYSFTALNNIVPKMASHLGDILEEYCSQPLTSDKFFPTSQEQGFSHLPFFRFFTKRFSFFRSSCFYIFSLFCR